MLYYVVMDHRRYSLIHQRPFVCLTHKEREMERAYSEPSHDYVELVGGPLDGTVFQEVGTKFDHNSHSIYVIAGKDGKSHQYRPARVSGRTLKMQYAPRGTTET